MTDQPGLLHEPQELSTSALAKLEAASDEVEFQQSIWDASLFLFNPVAGRLYILPPPPTNTKKKSPLPLYYP